MTKELYILLPEGFVTAKPSEIAEAAGVVELLEIINGFERSITNLKQEVHDGLSLDAELRYEISKLHKQLSTVTKQRDGLLEAADALMSSLMNKGVAAQKYAVDLRAAIADCKSKKAAE